MCSVVECCFGIYIHSGPFSSYHDKMYRYDTENIHKYIYPRNRTNRLHRDVKGNGAMCCLIDFSSFSICTLIRRFSFFLFLFFICILQMQFKIVDAYSGSRPYRFDARCSSVLSCHDYCCHGRRRRRRHYHLLDDLCDHRSDYFAHDYFDRRLDWQSLILKPDNLYNMRGMVVYLYALLTLVIWNFILLFDGNVFFYWQFLSRRKKNFSLIGIFDMWHW